MVDVRANVDNLSFAEMARNNLFFCTSKEEVEEVFRNKNITEPIEKSRWIMGCMGVIKTYRATGDFTAEDDYHDDLIAFVEGSWRQFL